MFYFSFFLTGVKADTLAGGGSSARRKGQRGWVTPGRPFFPPQPPPHGPPSSHAGSNRAHWKESQNSQSPILPLWMSVGRTDHLECALPSQPPEKYLIFFLSCTCFQTPRLTGLGNTYIKKNYFCYLNNEGFNFETHVSPGQVFMVENKLSYDIKLQPGKIENSALCFPFCCSCKTCSDLWLLRWQLSERNFLEVFLWITLRWSWCSTFMLPHSLGSQMPAFLVALPASL